MVICIQMLGMIAKYYERMYHKIDGITKHDRVSPTGKVIPLRKLYTLYSYKGTRRKKGSRGNFLSYVARAKTVFGASEEIDRGTRHAWAYMQKRLKRRLSSNTRTDSTKIEGTP